MKNFLIAQNTVVNNPVLDSGVANLTGEDFVEGLIRALILFFLIAGSLIFLLMLVTGAIGWMTSEGDKMKTQSAKTKITNAFIGLVILFSIFAIIQFVEHFLGFNLLYLRLGSLEI